MIAIKRIFEAYLDEMQLITILLPHSYHHGQSATFHLVAGEESFPLELREKVTLGDSEKYICSSNRMVEPGGEYKIVDEHGSETDLQIGAVIRTPEFDQIYFYDGDDLGANVSEEKTVFKVWAPTASKAKLKLVKESEIEELDMHREEKGVWKAELEGDYEGVKYLFCVCINLEWREAVDPYAKSVTANGQYGVAVRMEKTFIEKPELPPLGDPCDAVIYEAHIRDLTIHPDSGASGKGRYTGVAETGTVNPAGNPTGLDYIKSLGVTHIEFLPFHDFEGVDELNPESSYNWGYNPVNFNVPDGSYATNPEDPYCRIIELKEMIQAVHLKGLRVIMDGVYNHVYIRESSSFEMLVPGYYFRHDEHGLPSDGTGVGNDIASERLMVRKFILDSVRYWLTEYQIDGLRLDLMGILDIETMNEMRRIADEVHPSTIIIGEGWDLNTPIPHEDKASIGNQDKLPRIGQFNDWFRDTVKGSTFNLYDRGFALGNAKLAEAASQVLGGSVGVSKQKHGIFLEPAQSVNYVESHDNHTLWDKLEACGSDFIEERHRLATGMVLLAQGIPFLHAGQEFYRTKQGIGNTYNQPDEINWMDWNRRDQHSENVEYIRGLISLRLSHKAFRFCETALVRQHMNILSCPQPVIGYSLEQVGEFGEWETILCYFNPAPEAIEVPLPEKGGWKIMADERSASANPIGEHNSETVVLQPCSLFVTAR